ncbi:MAG TPA: hypothetical protein VI007_11205 [bacterium]
MAGASRGAFAVVANNMLGSGILLSSSVTVGVVVGGCPGPITDGFTYVVSDGKGGITASFVVVNVP